MNEPILHEAHVLHIMTRAMKIQRKVWLRFEGLVELCVAQYNEAILRLTEANVLQRETITKRPGLTWAVMQQHQFLTKLGKRTTPTRFIHDLDIPPVWVRDLFRHPPEEIRADTLCAVDILIDAGRVATSMLEVNWEGCDEHSISFEPFLHELSVKRTAEGMGLLREMGIGNTRTLVVSDKGVYTCVPREHFLVQWVSPYPHAENPTYTCGEITMVTRTIDSNYRIVQSNQGRQLVVDDQTLCAFTKPAGCCTYVDMLQVRRGVYDHVVLIGNRFTSIRWKRQALHIMNNKVNGCTFIFVGAREGEEVVDGDTIENE
jgi:hypothetical protein